MYRSLMVPLDGESFGEYALPLALGIARRGGGSVQLVHVCASPAPTAVTAAAPIGDEAQHAPDRERAAAYLRALASCLSERWDVPITTALLDGSVVDTLYAHALASRADLVVMTTHSHGPLPRIHLGSVADALVRRLPVPTLLARPHDEVLDLLEAVHEHVFQHVLIPLDGSTLAEAIVERAVALGTPMDAEYAFLQVLDLPTIGYAPALHATGTDTQILEQWRGEAQHYLDRVAEPLGARGLRVRAHTIIGSPASAILEYSREHAVDLIAIATHGRGGLARVLLGSVADAVLHGAGVPVLLFRPSDQALEVRAGAHQAGEQAIGIVKEANR
jgi:nucleotide-binding universal stress UspA family protein